jgi:hypothetical protein
MMTLWPHKIIRTRSIDCVNCVICVWLIAHTSSEHKAGSWKSIFAAKKLTDFEGDHFRWIRCRCHATPNKSAFSWPCWLVVNIWISKLMFAATSIIQLRVRKLLSHFYQLFVCQFDRLIGDCHVKKTSILWKKKTVRRRDLRIIPSTSRKAFNRLRPGLSSSSQTCFHPVALTIRTQNRRENSIAETNQAEPKDFINNRNSISLASAWISASFNDCRRRYLRVIDKVSMTKTRAINTTMRAVVVSFPTANLTLFRSSFRARVSG